MKRSVAKHDFVGKKFGELVVLEKTTERTAGHVKWLCQCSCGTYTKVPMKELLRGRSKRCKKCKNKRMSEKYKKQNTGLKQLFLTYKLGSVKRKISFNLSIKDFKTLTQSNCFYCNLQPSNKLKLKGKIRYVYNGIDRVDNSKGYVLDNCVSCCKFCNRAKSVGDVKEFQEWLNYLKNEIRS